MASHPKFSRFATVLEVDPRTKAEVAPENAWEVSDDTTISRHWKRWLLVEHVVDQEPKRHPLPNVTALASTFSRLGITSGIQVVAYDQDNGMFASRLWWLLRWMGHHEAAVLDGGFARWIAEQRPTTAGRETRPAETFAGFARADMVAKVEEVARLSETGSARLVDARAPERYRGEIEPIDRVPGHIPGAINDHFMQNVDEHGMFRPPDALRTRLTAALAGAQPGEVVFYCGSGVTACHSLLALELAGLPASRLYPGSWSEWSSDPSRPVETGPEGTRKNGPAM